MSRLLPDPPAFTFTNNLGNPPLFITAKESLYRWCFMPGSLFRNQVSKFVLFIYGFYTKRRSSFTFTFVFDFVFSYELWLTSRNWIASENIIVTIHDCYNNSRILWSAVPLVKWSTRSINNTWLQKIKISRLQVKEFNCISILRLIWILSNLMINA